MTTSSPHFVSTLFVSLLVVAGAVLPAHAGGGAGAAVAERWVLGGTGGWDYLSLDETGARLFISRGTRVDVLDTRSGKVTASIANTSGVHGIAIAGALHRGYTSNGKADSVSVFDLDTLQVIKEAPVSGHNPDAIVYDATGEHVFTFNGRSKDVTVLDAHTLGIVKTLPMPDKPEFAVDDDSGSIFVNIESESGQMAVVDSRRLTIRAIWALPGCAAPTGLALDKVHHRLFSVCDHKVMAVTDALTGKQVARVAIGDGPDAAAFDSRRHLVFSSNGDGTLTVIHQDDADRYSVEASLATMRGARTMALDSAGGRAYLVSSEFLPAADSPQKSPQRPTPSPDTFTVLVVTLPER